MNDHGTMTVEVPESNEIRHICAYETPEIRRTLGTLPVEATVPVELSRIGVRGDVWRAVGLTARQSATGSQPVASAECDGGPQANGP
jgi:hypothetical protein